MKKLFFLAAVVLTWTACGNKTKSGEATADSLSVPTVVYEVPDTLNTVEAVIKQVNAVYDRWNDMRLNYKEGMPSLDDLFGTKEWRQVMDEVAEVNRECECGGFFDFGDEGPLDPWTYDCYEGTVSADSIEVKLLENGMAEVNFLVKDAVTIKGIPIRWLMRVEDGQWRVANIFFMKDGKMDLLAGMRGYADDGKFNKDFDIHKYHDQMVEIAESATGSSEPFAHYALVDIDRDGKPEICAIRDDITSMVVFSIADGKPSILMDSFGPVQIMFFEHGVGTQGSCGTGCHAGSYTLMKDSKAVTAFNTMSQYDMEGELAEQGYSKDDKDITEEAFKQLYEQLGEYQEIEPIWHEIEVKKNPLADYAE